MKIICVIITIIIIIITKEKRPPPHAVCKGGVMRKFLSGQGRDRTLQRCNALQYNCTEHSALHYTTTYWLAFKPLDTVCITTLCHVTIVASCIFTFLHYAALFTKDCDTLSAIHRTPSHLAFLLQTRIRLLQHFHCHSHYHYCIDINVIIIIIIIIFIIVIIIIIIITMI